MGNITGGPFISEFHYEDISTDEGEFVEICAPSAASASGFSLVFYNGNGSTYGSTINLDNITPCTGADGNTYYVVEPSFNIQNGNPDGFALVDAAGVVCEFLSYEGIIAATEGPANGTMSMDIGVAESNTTTIEGTSIQLQPNGTWEAGIPETPKEANICFFAGTNILTRQGYVRIENLKEGDIVTTANGKEMPIKWVGIQSVNIHSKRNLLKSNPVLIQANALGDGTPSSDLRVSPNHAIYVEGILINAGALVNGVNIYQEVPTEDFKYYHIELDAHELVIAENTWAESYLPQNENRDDFDNAAEFDQQYPDGRKLILWPLDFPRISSQSKVPDYIQDMILRKEETRKIA